MVWPWPRRWPVAENKSVVVTAVKSRQCESEDVIAARLANHDVDDISGDAFNLPLWESSRIRTSHHIDILSAVDERTHLLVDGSYRNDSDDAVLSRKQTIARRSALRHRLHSEDRG